MKNLVLVLFLLGLGNENAIGSSHSHVRQRSSQKVAKAFSRGFESRKILMRKAEEMRKEREEKEMEEFYTFLQGVYEKKEGWKESSLYKDNIDEYDSEIMAYSIKKLLEDDPKQIIEINLVINVKGYIHGTHYLAETADEEWRREFLYKAFMAYLENTPEEQRLYFHLKSEIEQNTEEKKAQIASNQQ